MSEKPSDNIAAHDKLLFSFGAIMIISALLSWAIRADPYPNNSEILPELLHDPEQTETEQDPFEFDRKGNNYNIVPLYEYQLYGLVVSKREDSFQHKVFYSDHVNEADLCVIWGDNISTNVYKDLKFKNSDWFCTWRPKNYNTWQRIQNIFKNDNISNNHLLSNIDEVRKNINKVKVGDQIRIDGLLSEYSTNGNPERGTSTSRTDTGNGACETIYVNNFEILKKGNPIADLFGLIAKTSLFILLIIIAFFRDQLLSNNIRTGSLRSQENPFEEIKNAIPKEPKRW